MEPHSGGAGGDLWGLCEPPSYSCQWGGGVGQSAIGGHAQSSVGMGGHTEPYWGKRGGTQSPIGMERNPEPYGDVGDGHTGPYWRPHGTL